jgi:hypothetical protein
MYNTSHSLCCPLTENWAHNSKVGQNVTASQINGLIFVVYTQKGPKRLRTASKVWYFLLHYHVQMAALAALYSTYIKQIFFNPAHFYFLCKPAAMFYQWLSFFVDLAEKPWEELATLFFFLKVRCVKN